MSEEGKKLKVNQEVHVSTPEESSEDDASDEEDDEVKEKPAIPATSSPEPPMAKMSLNDEKADSSSKVKPSLNADAESSPSKGSPKTSGKAQRFAPLPAWEENQSFFDDDEPLKPPE